jgi:hypothetical protein
VSISIYTLIYSTLLFIIPFLRILKISEHVILFIFLLILSLSVYRFESINSDTINYYWYFRDALSYHSFAELYQSQDWIKIEPGFKMSVYLLSFFESPFLNFVLFNLINIYIFLYLYLRLREINIKTFSIFLYFYVCFFIFIFDLAILRFSLSALIMLVAFHHLIYKHCNVKIFFLVLLSGLFHLSGFIFGFILLYFHFTKIFKIMWIAPFIFILIFKDFLPFFASNLEVYYYNLIVSKSETHISPRIVLELLIFAWSYFFYRKTHFNFFHKLLFISYLLSSFIEVYYGLVFFNRIRVVAWLLFLYFVATTWKLNMLNNSFKVAISMYAVIIFSYQAVNNLEEWN